MHRFPASEELRFGPLFFLTSTTCYKKFKLLGSVQLCSNMCPLGFSPNCIFFLNSVNYLPWTILAFLWTSTPPDSSGHLLAKKPFDFKPKWPHRSFGSWGDREMLPFIPFYHVMPSPPPPCLLWQAFKNSLRTTPLWSPSPSGFRAGPYWLGNCVPTSEGWCGLEAANHPEHRWTGVSV